MAILKVIKDGRLEAMRQKVLYKAEWDMVKYFDTVLYTSITQGRNHCWISREAFTHLLPYTSTPKYVCVCLCVNFVQNTRNFSLSVPILHFQCLIVSIYHSAKKYLVILKVKGICEMIMNRCDCQCGRSSSEMWEGCLCWQL